MKETTIKQLHAVLYSIKDQAECGLNNSGVSCNKDCILAILELCREEEQNWQRLSEEN